MTRFQELRRGGGGGLARFGMLLLAAWLIPACGRQADAPEDRASDEGVADRPAGGRAAAIPGGDSQQEVSLGDPVLVVEDLKTPESVAIGPDGRYYVSLIGEFGKEGDGAIVILDPETGEQTPYASGLFDPAGIIFKGDTLLVADRKGVLRVAPGGAVSVLAAAGSFPRPPQFLNDVAFDANGDLLVSDSGDLKSKGGAIFRVAPDGRVSIFAGSDTIPDLATVNGLARGPDGIYAVGFGSGALYVTDAAGGWRKIASGLGSSDGLAFDASGRLFVTDHVGGAVLLVDVQGAAGDQPAGGGRKIAGGLDGAADLTVDEKRGRLVIPALRANRLDVYDLP